MAYSKNVLFLGLLPFVGTVFGAYVEEVNQEQPSENVASERPNELVSRQGNESSLEEGALSQNQLKNSSGVQVGDEEQKATPSNRANGSSLALQDHASRRRALPQPNLPEEAPFAHNSQQNPEANWSVVPANLLQEPKGQPLPADFSEKDIISYDNFVRGKLEEFLNTNKVDSRFVDQFILFLKELAGKGNQKNSSSAAMEQSEPNGKVESIEKLRNNDEEIKDFLYQFGNQSNQNTIEIQNLKGKIGSLESLLHMVMVMTLCR